MPIPGALDASNNQNARDTIVVAASLVLPDLHLFRLRDVACASASRGLSRGPRVVADGNQLALYIGMTNRNRVGIAKL